MATLLHLASEGAVVKLDAALSWREQEERRIYVLPRVRKWLENELPALGSDWDLESSPIEQLDALLAIYCSGATLTFQRQFYPIRHIAQGIWELKTADLRLFGWSTRRTASSAPPPTPPAGSRSIGSMTDIETRRLAI